jgi:zinc protease
LAAAVYAAENADVVPRVPEQVQAVMAALPAEARPQQMDAARNGAIYALLPNGCEIIVKEKHNAPVVAVQAWVRTGAMDEGKSLGAGLSHFCEHLLFKGTNKRPTGVLDQEIRGAGGDENAYTTSERTVYHITTAKEGFDVAFGAVADMLMDSTFPPGETLKEHAVVTKEIERAQDDPDTALWMAFQRTIYQTHPYRVPVLGYPDLFKAVTRDQVFEYYKERYTPQLTTFIVVGDIDAATVMPKMTRELAQWKRKSIAPVIVPPEPEQVAPRSVTLTHPLAQVPKLILGFPGVSMRDPDVYAFDVLASILGDGRASRLYRTVKDKEQLVTEISTYNDTPMYPGAFMVLATIAPGKVEAAREAIVHVVEEAKTKKPSREELERAKRKVHTQHILLQMTAEGQAEDIGNSWFVAGSLDFSSDYTQRIQQVTSEDVERVARKYLVPERLNEAVMLPHRAVEQQAQEAQAERRGEVVTAKHERAAELQELRADPGVAKVNLLEDKSVFEIELKPSGLRVVVCEDASLPVVNVSIAALGGTRWEPAELAGAGNVLANMLDHGTAKRSKLKLAEEVEALGARLSTFSGRNSFGVSTTGLKEDLAALMALASDCMLHPSFPKEEAEQVKQEVLQQIAQEDESLIVSDLKLLRPLLYGVHPYSRQVAGTAATVEKIGVEDLKRLHAAWVQPENLAVGFVGDVSALEAVRAVQQHFGALKAGSFVAPGVAGIPKLETNTSAELRKAEITGAVLALGFQGTTLKSPARETLDLIAALLSGLGGRLNINLREKQGLAYDVGVMNDAQLDGGAIVFYIQTDEQALDKALAGMWAEVNVLRKDLVPAKELETVKKYVLGTEAIELQNQSDLAQRLALSQLYGEGAAHVFSRRARLDSVTAEALRAAAQKYLDPQHWGKAVVKPAAEK